MLRYFILVNCLCFTASLFAQQQPCKTNAWVDVVFVKLKESKDTSTQIKKSPTSASDQGGGYSPKYKLQAVNSNFNIVSFVISCETNDDDIVEVSHSYTYLTGRAEIAFITRKPGSIVFFSCIKAMHKNGRVYILKPLQITP